MQLDLPEPYEELFTDLLIALETTTLKYYAEDDRADHHRRVLESQAECERMLPLRWNTSAGHTVTHFHDTPGNHGTVVRFGGSHVHGLLSIERMNKMLKSSMSATSQVEEALARAWGTVRAITLRKLERNPALLSPPDWDPSNTDVRVVLTAEGVDDRRDIPPQSALAAALRLFYARGDANERDADIILQCRHHAACTIDGVLFRTVESQRTNTRSDNSCVMHTYLTPDDAQAFMYGRVLEIIEHQRTAQDEPEVFFKVHWFRNTTTKRHLQLVRDDERDWNRPGNPAQYVPVREVYAQNCIVMPLDARTWDWDDELAVLYRDAEARFDPTAAT